MSDRIAQIEKLCWDSDFFNLEIGQLTVTKSEDLENLVLNTEFDLVYVNSIFSIGKFEKISYRGTKVEFKKVLNTQKLDIYETTALVNVDIVYYNKFEKDLKELAYLSGHQSRFYRDPKFKKADFRKLYDKWLENALNRTHDNVFIAYHDESQNKPTAILTGNISNTNLTARVGLIAVDKNQQGKGLGKLILRSFEQLGKTSSCNMAVIPTQIENQGACKFYESLGYKATQTYLVYHLWK